MKKIKYIIIFTLLLGVAFIIFLQPDLTENIEFVQEQKSEIEETISFEQNSSIEYIEHSFQTSSSTGKFHVIKISSNVSGSISVLEDQSVPKFVSVWLGDKKGVAINAGYFHEDQTPSGFLVADGERVGGRMFDQDKSGLFGGKDGKFFIRDLDFEPIDEEEHFDFAVQSFPFLIKNGKSSIDIDSGKIARRSAVGIDYENNLYFILSSSSQLSLFEFANAIVGMDIEFSYVLNLDGGPSSGLVSNIPGAEVSVDSYVLVPNVIQVLLN